VRADLLPGAWIAPQATRDLRALLRHRAALVRLSTSLTNRVRAVLADRGIADHPGCGLVGGGRGCGDLELPATPRGTRPGLLRAARRPGHPDRPAGTRDRRPGQTRPTGPALMVLPGVGKLTAMTLVAEVGEGARFPTARKLCAWAGLTPQVRNLRPHPPPRPHHQTGLALGARDPPGKPPRRPSATPPSPAPTPELARRRGSHIATTAIARRLLARCVHVLTQLGAAPAPEKASTGRARVFRMSRPHGRPA
jgi:hypothetical protein